MGNKILSTSNEKDEIEKRKCNLIIRGIPEDTDTSDQRLVEELLPNLKLNADLAQQYLGRQGQVHADGNPRPVKLKCKDEESKKILLKSSRDIRKLDQLSYDNSKVNIYPDLTKLQRARDYQLREERRRKV